MSSSSSSPRIAAVVTTHNRAGLLTRTLEGLAGQTIPPSDYEVIVVDDGSTDDTRGVASAFGAKLPLKYAYQQNAGLASARNHGLYLSRAPLLLFLDDDDVPDQRLLEQHVRSHEQYPADNRAVLGYTRLDASIAADPLMHFVTEIGCFLFSYLNFNDGDLLDYEHFWGGRSSCKRAFLLEHGVFNPTFRFGCEDIELAYRLSKYNFRVVYNAKAVTAMVRGVDFDGFCRRLVRQGRSNYVFSRLHAEAEVQSWTEVADFDQAWYPIEPEYEAILCSARHLDRAARLKLASGFEVDDAETALLHRAYWGAFRAAKLKGINDARLEAVEASLPSAAYAVRANEAAPFPVDLHLAQTPRRVGQEGDSMKPEQADGACFQGSEELTNLGIEVRTRDETIRLLRIQAARQQEVIDAQRAALQTAQIHISDLERSLGWRIASFVRELHRRFSRSA
jgi:GT2 family glycosyltransferase